MSPTRYRAAPHRRARPVDAVDRARILALFLQRRLGLTDVFAALGLGRDLVLGLARLGLGLVDAAVDLRTHGILALGLPSGLGLVFRGLLLVAADLVLELVL